MKKQGLKVFTSITLAVLMFLSIGLEGARSYASSGPSTEENKKDESSKKVIELTLEEVLKKGIEDNHNLMILQYQVDMARQQVIDQILMSDQNALQDEPLLPITTCTQPTQGDTAAEDAYQECQEQNRLNRELNQWITAQNAMNTQRRKQIANASMELMHQEQKSTYEQQDAIESIRFNLKQSYVNLWISKETIEFRKHQLSKLEKDLGLQLIQKNRGSISKKEYEKAEKQIENSKKEIKKMEEARERNKRKLLWNLNLDLSKEYKLAEIDLKEIKEFDMPVDIKEWVKKSNKMKMAQEEINRAKVELSQIENGTYSNYNQKESAKKQGQTKVKIMEERAKQLELDLELRVLETYDSANDLVEQYSELQDSIADLRDEVALTRVLYSQGFASQTQLDQLELQLKQMELEVSNLQYKYFMMDQLITSFSKGFIQ